MLNFNNFYIYKCVNIQLLNISRNSQNSTNNQRFSEGKI